MSGSQRPAKFELNRLAEINKDTIAAELRRVAESCDLAYLPMHSLRQLGSRVSRNTVSRHFGSWEAALKYAGLEHMFAGTQEAPAGIAHRNRNRTTDEIIGTLCQVALTLGKSEVTIAEVKHHSEIRQYVIRKRFGSWSAALKAAGLGKSNLGKRYTDEECFENLLAVWTHHGRPPQYNEMAQPPSRVGGKAYVRRFGTWNKALAAFVERVNEDTAENSAANHPEKAERNSDVEDSRATKKADRDEEHRGLRLGLRFAILQRDRFRCVACGASPATDLGCVLHVDHIIPFSKGGKTIVDNLRTLCADCNIGRGNRFEPETSPIRDD